MGSRGDPEVECSASDHQGSNFKTCVWRVVSSHSSHHPQEVILPQFSQSVHKCGLKPHSFIHWIPEQVGHHFVQDKGKMTLLLLLLMPHCHMCVMHRPDKIKLLRSGPNCARETYFTQIVSEKTIMGDSGHFCMIIHGLLTLTYTVTVLCCFRLLCRLVQYKIVFALGIVF